MPPCKTALVAAVSLSMSVVMAEQDLQGRAACASQWGQCGGLVWTGEELESSLVPLRKKLTKDVVIHRSNMLCSGNFLSR